MRWRLASVFAQDQVDALPPPAQPAPLEPPGDSRTCGISHAELIAPLTALAGELGYTLAITA